MAMVAWGDPLPLGLVVERHVAADDRRLERAAASAIPSTRLLELHITSGFSGAEVRQSVVPIGTAPERPGCARASATARRALRRIEPAVTGIAVDGQRQGEAGSLQPDDRGSDPGRTPFAAHLWSYSV